MKAMLLSGLVLGLILAGASDRRVHTPGAPSGKPCKFHENCDLNYLCKNWQNFDAGLGNWCVLGCRSDHDCREAQVCVQRGGGKFCHAIATVE